jgi:addiction module HigA family antidote
MMKNPPHPGSVVKELCLEPLDLNITDAAKILGIGRPALSAFINGRASLSLDMAIRISKAFGPDLEHLLKMQMYYDLAQAQKRAAEIDVERYSGIAQSEARI